MPLQSKKGIVSQNTQNNLETWTKNIQQLEPGFQLRKELYLFITIYTQMEKNVLMPTHSPKNPICTFKYVKKIQDCSWGNTPHTLTQCKMEVK